MDDHELVLAIRDTLDAREWNADVLQEIADLLRNNGYPIEDCT